MRWTSSAMVGGSCEPMQVQRRRRRVHDRVHRLDAALAAERQRAAEHLVEQDAERENIGAVIDRAAARLLRRHVGDGAEDDIGIGSGDRDGVALAGERRQQLREAEVDHLGVAVLGEHHVGGLEIAMHDALGVGA